MSKSKVFFSCVCKDCYKEFIIDNYDEFVDTLNKDEFFLLKYSSAFSLEEQQLSFEKLSIVQKLKRIIGSRVSDKSKSYLVLNDFFTDNEEVNKYFLNLLSTVRMEEYFSLPLDKINDYFYALGKACISNAALADDFVETMLIYNSGETNFKEMIKRDLLIVEQDNLFSIEKKEEPIKKETEFEYIKVNNIRKIS